MIFETHHLDLFLIFDLHADDSNLFYSNKNLTWLEYVVNDQLSVVHIWLCDNKLLLFVIFHPVQKKVNYNLHIQINSQIIKYDIQIIG